MSKEPGPMKTADITSAVGAQVMDQLNKETAAGGLPLAMKGHALDDGSFEFLLGPVYLPHDGIKLALPEARRLFANLRLETERLASPKRVRWLCKRGDAHAETPQPQQAIVVEEIKMPLDEDMIEVYYHNTRG